MKKPELLAPAGGAEALRTAVLYGADAVYLGGSQYGLRAKARNFDRQQMQQSILYAHEHGVRVYVTVNIIAHNEHLEGLEEYLRALQEDGADALIIADAGIFRLARQTVPEMEIHLSTQASATNYRTFQFWQEQGAKRIVAARELSLKELVEIREKTGEELEIEAFVHGAMCISISGRCLLSNYMAARDANLGACVHPCRWKYRLVEETRPGEYYPVLEEEEGTYFFNSKDLCMIAHIPELVQAGISSLKIEGRMKTPLYVAMVTKVYREALDDYLRCPADYEAKKDYYLRMLSQVSHRGYNTGFYFGHPDHNSQVYDTSAYQKQMTFAAKVIRTEGEELVLEQRSKFSRGDTLYLLRPQGEPEAYFVNSIRAEDGTGQESASHAQQKVRITAPPRPVPEGCILMKPIEEPEDGLAKQAEK